MARKLALLLALMLAMGTVSAVTVSCSGKKHKKHKKGWKKHKKHKKHKKYKKHKKHKKFKAKVPAVTLEEAREDVKNLGKYLFKVSVKKDFDTLKKIVLTAEEGKDFAKPEFFQKYVNEKKMKEKYEKWQGLFKGTKFIKVKAKDEDKKTFKPGDKDPKFQELIDNITKEVVVWQAKVMGKNRMKETAKCSFVAIKLKDKDWRLIRLKGCKVQ